MQRIEISQLLRRGELGCVLGQGGDDLDHSKEGQPALNRLIAGFPAASPTARATST
jgi:hypothetical protein